MPLKVSGAFHSPFMAEAAEGMREAVKEYAFAEPRIPLYSNVTGAPYGAEIGSGLAAQVESPVRWTATVKDLAERGVTRFVEVGVGKTLEGLVKKTLPEAAVCHIEDKELSLIHIFTAVERDLDRAIEAAYRYVEQVRFKDAHFRRDIGVK